MKNSKKRRSIILTHDTDTAFLSVCLSVRLSDLVIVTTREDYIVKLFTPYGMHHHSSFWHSFWS